MNNEILSFEDQNEVIINSEKLKKSKINKIKSQYLIKNMNVSNKKKIVKKIKGYLRSYYLASIESSLENSFFKFWSLSESMIKDIGGEMNDDKLKKVMKNILKANSYYDFHVKRVDILHIKRNAFAHETVHGKITLHDQALMKVVAERLIEFFIKYLDIVKNHGEYWQLLNYFFMGEDEKIRRIQLMESTLPNYSFSLRFYSK